MKRHNPMTGVHRLENDLTLVEVWQGLHADAEMWQRAERAPDVLSQRAAIGDNTRALLKALEGCDAARWQSFIIAQGVTQYGAIALSWCKDTTIAEVADLFFTDIETPDALDPRAAGFLGPAHRSESRSLSDLAEQAEGKTTVLMLLCLSDPKPLSFDVGDPWLAELPGPVGKLLLERHDPKVSRLPDAILESWQAV